MDLKSIEGLVDRLSGKVEALVEERDALRRDANRLGVYAIERDEECVRARREMILAIEAAADEFARREHSGSEIGARLQTPNDRLIGLALQGQRGCRT